MNQNENEMAVPGAEAGNDTGTDMGSSIRNEPGVAELGAGLPVPPWSPGGAGVGTPLMTSAEAAQVLASGGEVPTPERVQEVVEQVTEGVKEPVSEPPPPPPPEYNPIGGEPERAPQASEEEEDDAFFADFLGAIMRERDGGRKVSGGNYAERLRAQMAKALIATPVMSAEEIFSRSREAAALEQLNGILEKISRKQEVFEEGRRALFRMSALIAQARGLVEEFHEDLKTIGETAPVLLDSIQEWLDLRLQGHKLAEEYVEIALKAKADAARKEDASATEAAPSGTF